MKANHRAVLVPGIPRKFILNKVAGSQCWHIIFTPPYEARKLGAPARVVRSTGVPFSSSISLAKQKAAEIIKPFWTGNGEVTEVLKQRSPWATIGEILSAYKPRSSDVRPKTAWACKCYLVKLLKDVFELETREQVEALRADVLTKQTAEKFLALRERRGKATGDARLFNLACITANSCLRQARSVISPKLDCYAHLKLPDFSGFRSVRFLSVGRDHVRYVSPGAAVFEAMDRDIYKLRKSQPFVFAAYWFMRYLGLRPSELVNARWNWLDRTPAGQWVYRVMLRPDFQPKVGPRDIPIEPEAKKLFDEIRGAAMPTAYIINLGFVTDREHILKYDINEWMRAYIPREQSEKCAYVLRKEAGSIVFHSTGSVEAAAQFLGDTIETAKKHYLADLPLARGISLSGPRIAAKVA